MNHSSDELNVIFQKLPEEMKDIIVSVDTANIIGAIGKKYNLHIDQTGILAEETGLVLLGLTHPTEFVSSLTKRLGIDRVIASQVASEINDQVFLRVRELLKDVHKNVDKVADEIEEPAHPSKDALMAAIENPDGMLKRATSPKEEGIPLVPVVNPYQPKKQEMGRDVPVVAPVPSRIEEPVPQTAEVPEDSTLRRLNLQKPDLQAQDILTQKMSGQFSMPKVETKVEAPSANSGRRVDPYKEQV